MNASIAPLGFNYYDLPNMTGGINAGFSPVFGQQYNSFGPYNTYAYSPTLVRDFNRFSQDRFVFNPRLVDNFNNFYNQRYDFAPEYIQNFNNRPSYSFNYLPQFRQNYNNFPPVYQYGGFPQPYGGRYF